MEITTIAETIVECRRKKNLTQQQLAEKLCVTNKAVSKWECGKSLPDVTLLVPLCRILGISVQKLLDDHADEYSNSSDVCTERGCALVKIENERRDPAMRPPFTSLHMDTNDRKRISPYLFSHNLEHTRACIFGGLSAQMLRNRKFAGRPQARCGVSAEWFAIGERAFFCNDQDPYVKHYFKNKMWRRNELNAQTVQNPLEGQQCGIGQDGLCLHCGARYTAAIVAKCSEVVKMTIQLTDRTGSAVYAEKSSQLAGDGWQRWETTLLSTEDDAEGCLRITFAERASVIFGAVSLLPEDHFHGMRRDVVEKMKEIGVGLLRWPGGNFAGDYRWQDMLLPKDMRAPLQAYTEDETQPYTHGYDMHEIDTDDFIALCREIGAEPYITVNLAWDSPEECAAWVEYCNSAADTPYGRLRAQRGHAEPYHVHYWSLGNEFGYGHMEGPMQPQDYARLSQSTARAMLKVSPDLELCSSGAYHDAKQAENWVKQSAMALTPWAGFISFHTYNIFNFDYTSPEAIRQTYQNAVVSSVETNIQRLRGLRAVTPAGIHISYDEWNLWAAWFRRSCSLGGMYAAEMLHAMLYAWDETDAPVLCYFQPVGEGAIDVFPDRAELSADGQAFSLLKVHKGAERCRIEGLNGHEAVASVRSGILSVSLINVDYDESRIFSMNRCGQIHSAKMLVASDLLPGSHLDERELPIHLTDDTIRVELLPRAIALVRISL